ncbi:PR domain zinc finger protein 14 [Thelohanellus kitauei]|uniref:PR domain zinc finger protein 14 n=1 Tax=Thelohanellus kitauei TaxID=669202 RepID=A0A0C2IY08_THEKT|nr:PR domain zinc finger protein 14 [Thelohanellus kitauei]
MSQVQEYFRNFAKFNMIKTRELWHLSVTALVEYAPGDVVGCFTGNFITSGNFHNHRINKDASLEIIENGKVIGVIDGDSDQTNWVKYIAKARNVYEQNVHIVYDGNNALRFIASRRILPGQEFLAWFHFQQWWNYFLTPGNSFEWPRNVRLREQPRLTQLEESKIGNTPPSEYGEIFHSAIQQNNEPVFGSNNCLRSGSPFSSYASLRRHMTSTAYVDAFRGHEYECTLCQIRFSASEGLPILSRRVHFGVERYKCSTCNKAFSRSSSLTKHIRTHTNNRPFQSSFCPKRFSSSSMLTTHARQPAGEKPFKCTICDQAFGSDASFHGYMRRTDNAEPPSFRLRRRPPG